MTGTRLMVCLGLALSAAPADPSSLDQSLADGLRDLNNRAAVLHNRGDAVGGYRVYEGGLTALLPLMNHRTDLRQRLAEGLRAAEQLPDASRRAHALHKVIAEVRRELLGRRAPATPGPGNPPASLPYPTPAAADPPLNPVSAPPQRPLWDRLGGEIIVRFCVEDLVKELEHGRNFDFTRGGRFRPEPSDVRQIQRYILGYLSDILEGTYVPIGDRSIRDWQTELALKDEEFEFALKEFRAILVKQKIISAGDVEAVCQKLRSAWREARAGPAKP